MGEVLKFVTLDWGLRKKNAKKFLHFLQKYDHCFGLKDLF